MQSTTQPTIIGLDPGTRFLGTAVLRGGELLAYAVNTLTNGGQPFEVIGQARRIVFGLIEQYDPQIVAIEAPYLIATPRGAVLTVLAKELHERAKDLGLAVQELSPEEVRRRVAGDSRATKYEVAQRLVQTFPHLARLVPKKPRIPVLWLTPKERYWLHMFDALALAASIRAQANVPVQP